MSQTAHTLEQTSSLTMNVCLEGSCTNDQNDSFITKAVERTSAQKGDKRTYDCAMPCMFVMTLVFPGDEFTVAANNIFSKSEEKSQGSTHKYVFSSTKLSCIYMHTSARDDGKLS